MSMETNCQLCLAVHEDRVVYRGTHVFVVVNLEPLKPAHVMVLPKEHVGRVGLMSPEASHEFLAVADATMQAVRAYAEVDPILVVNDGKHRSQPGHLHAHVLPSSLDLRRLFVAAEGVPYRERRTDEELAVMARKLRERFVAPPEPASVD